MIVLFEYQPGYVIAKLGGTATRASNGTYFDVNGVLQTAGNNVLRDGHYIGGVRTTLLEGSRTNIVLHNRDLTQSGSWTVSNMTAALNQTGIDGAANSASSLTATAGNATIVQTTVLASSTRAQSVYVKRITGTGTIQMTTDGGVTWNTITVTASYALQWFSQTAVTNPAIGFRIVTNGDAIAVDYVQNETGAFPSSPIATTTASVTRAADALTFPISFAPQALTIYANVVDLGSYQAVNNPYYASLGNPGTSPNMRVFIQVSSSTQTTMRVGDSNAETSAITTNIAYGNTVEVRGIMDANQGVNMGASINRGAEIVGTDSGARASLDTAFSGGVLGLTYGNTNGNVFHALSKLVIATGVQSLATMRAIPSQNTGQSTTQTLSPISVIAEQAFFGQPLATAIDTGTATALQAVATCPNGQSQVRVTSVTVSTSAAPAAGTPVQIIDQGTGLPIWQVTLSATGPFRKTFKFDPKPLRGSIGANVTAEMASAGGSVVQTMEMTYDTVASP